MKITIESYKKKYTVETEHDNHDIHEYMEFIEGLLILSGFTPGSVREGIIALAESYQDGQ